MDHWHPMIFDHVWYYKWTDFRQWATREPERPLVLMLGSSRTDDAFRARELDGRTGRDGRTLRAYNFGIPGAGPMHEWLYLQDMLEAGHKPSLLLIEYLPPLFNTPRPGIISEEHWTAGPWLQAAHLLRLWPYLRDPKQKGKEWLESRVAPASVFRAHFQERLREWCKGEPPLPILVRGHDPWGCHEPESITLVERERRWIVSRELYGHSLRHFVPWPGSANALRRLVQRCRREEIPLVLVVMPESSRYRELYTPACRENADRLLAELRSSGTPVIDANGWLDDEDFSDGHHANESGSAKFTARLLRELEPLLR
jgi:hypothetical protein